MQKYLCHTYHDYYYKYSNINKYHCQLNMYRNEPNLGYRKKNNMMIALALKAITIH